MKRTVAVVALLLALAACTSGLSTSTTTGVSPGSAAPTASSVVTTALGDTAAPSLPVDIKASGLLGGNAAPNIPIGDPGKVSVVVVGPVPTEQSPGFSIPIIIRNNTSKGVGRVEVVGAARDATGKLVASGTSQGFDPVSMKTGEAALGYIYYSPGTIIPSNAKFDFTVTTSEPSAGSSFDLASLKVTEANLVNKKVVGKANNTTGRPLQGPFSVRVSCFDGTGNLVESLGEFASPDKLESDGAATFQVDLFDRACTTFLVGANGYYS